jgi:hypothetical protein
MTNTFVVEKIYKLIQIVPAISWLSFNIRTGKKSCLDSWDPTVPARPPIISKKPDCLNTNG